MNLRHLVGIALLLLVTVPSAAQTERFDVNGIVVDHEDLPLPQATVVLLTQADSVMAKFTTTAADGRFTLRRVVADKYILQITYVGFATLRQNIEILDEDVDAGKLTMSELSEELGEVIVSADHVPFVVKRDTLEYNANAFAVRPNDVVEDLLKRLPGIEVENDGTVKALGETVENILVDGKEFFADTPTAVTKNLPAEAVDKVQVYDKDSDEAEFTGIPDGEEERTLDLLLKEDAKQGLMGNLSGAIGGEQSPGGRYDTRLNLMRFSPNTQLSLIGNANNTGQSGFGITDLLGLMAAGGLQDVSLLRNAVSPTNSGGFVESIAVGFNAGHDFSKNNYLRGSYFVDKLQRVQNSTNQRHELADANIAAYGEGSSVADSDNLGHRVNLNAQVQLSPGHQIRSRATMQWNSSNTEQTGIQQTFGQRQFLLNEAHRTVDQHATNLNGSGILTWRKKISERGTSLVTTAQFSLSDNDQITALSTRTGLAGSGNLMTWQEVQQDQDLFGKSEAADLKLSLTHPLKSGFSLLAFGERDFSRRENDKRFYNTSNDERLLNSRLSNAFEQTYTYYRAGLQLNRKGTLGFLTLEVRLQQSQLDGTTETGMPPVRASYTHLLPQLRYERALKENQDIEFSYRAMTREPSLRELQPFTDNSDPLRIYVGNPNLEPEFRHMFSGRFNSFDPWTQLNIFANISTTYARNQIVPTRIIDESLRQSVSAINSDAGWTTSAFTNVGMPIRPLNIVVRWSNNLTITTGSEFINSNENASRILRNRLGLSVSNRNQEIVELEARISGTYNDLDYSLNTDLNQRYINASYSFDIQWHPAFNWTIGTEFRYQTYDRDVFGDVQNKALIDLTFERLFMDERASVAIEIKDLLNQNLSVAFNNSASFISEQRTETLGRYVMLRLSYRLSALGGGLFGI
ncbi:MAG: outer membrane beta-barrel protein [Rhodothermaceae bacterium]|nr:outer membrane beta-barrel protein [Rhodothermaceae bacterium]MYG70040.1 outer membrane beta-barrel protein [Rhodothermaceae bacterium]MYJ43905.1 outer membrane beta-barrel protein [Rhodothermaceae bacterium]